MLFGKLKSEIIFRRQAVYFLHRLTSEKTKKWCFAELLLPLLWKVTEWYLIVENHVLIGQIQINLLLNPLLWVGYHINVINYINNTSITCVFCKLIFKQREKFYFTSLYWVWLEKDPSTCTMGYFFPRLATKK